MSSFLGGDGAQTSRFVARAKKRATTARRSSSLPHASHEAIPRIGRCPTRRREAGLRQEIAYE
ncbi:hypothetical protein A7982_13491 [Minicystis rosea]|nr:hypothetical protein A7982_13491 [Minicystis rosea]